VISKTNGAKDVKFEDFLPKRDEHEETEDAFGATAMMLKRIAAHNNAIKPRKKS